MVRDLLLILSWIGCAESYTDNAITDNATALLSLKNQ